MAKAKRSSARAGRPVVLVTGAGSGIGRATSMRLANDGFSVACADVDAAGAKRTAEKLPASLALAIDVREPESCESVVAQIYKHYGRLDAVVAAAGVNAIIKTRGDLMEIAEFRRIIDINLTGVYLTARAAARAMIKAKQPGRMVFLGSIASKVSTPGSAVYSASKAGVLNLGRTLAVEWAPFKIAVNIVGPGVIETPMTAASRANPAKAAEFISRIPLGRYGQPEEIASVISFLLSADSAYMTGSYVTIDGGWLA
ncbi:MAG: SDR family oxidoreductase [Rhodospirillales bacterium]|nr:SDR family oxidoreductase [Rhodospirillales bacterium]